ncbi:MAG TPA: L-lactate permease [Chloroflexi bacterium]|jgi:lactate permease|nr:L-lactate permease [Chloroflexota bacterium]
MEANPLPTGIVPWLIALLPIVVLLVLLVGLRWKGIEAGPLGMVTATLVALLAFRTPLETLAVAAGKGLWDAVFILYVVWAALLLYLVTVRAGAFEALREGFLGFSRNELFLVLAIGWVFASFFQGIAGFGAPIAVTAPLLIGIGVRPLYAVVIPLIAHTWAKMFGTLAVGWLAMLNVVGVADPTATAVQTAILLWLINLLGGLAVAWFYGRGPAVRHALPMILIISALHGGLQLVLMYINPILSTFVAGTAALVALYPLSHWRRYAEPATGIAERPAMVAPGDEEQAVDGLETALPEECTMTLGLALLPYVLLTVLATVALAIPPVNAALSRFEIGLPFPAVQTGFGVAREAALPYSPFSPLTHPGTFVLIAALVSLGVYRWRGCERADPSTRDSLWRNLVKDSVPSSIAIASFLVMSKVMDHSGQTMVLAGGLAAVATPTIYAFAANWIGILGAFMTSSSTASNILFSPLQAQAAAALEGLSQASVLAGQGAGGATGNVIAPANIVLGTSTSRIPGQEGIVLRRVLPWTVLTAVLTGLLTVLLNALGG